MLTNIINPKVTVCLLRLRNQTAGPIVEKLKGQGMKLGLKFSMENK